MNDSFNQTDRMMMFEKAKKKEEVEKRR